MAERERSRRVATGTGRKALFAVVVVLALLVLAEIVGWAVLRFTDLGDLARANPVDTVDEVDQMVPIVLDRPVRPLTGIDRIEVRDVSDPDLRERRVWLDEPPADEAAVLLGGSSPFGVGLTNKDSFWWLLDRADPSAVEYLNLANVGDNSHATRSQIARFVGFGGRPTLVVLYTGDNEWIGFRYPRTRLPSATRLDSILIWSKAYTSLRTLTRLAAQSSLYEAVEAERRVSSFSLTRFPLDTRYRGFDERTREFVTASRIRLVEKFVANLEAVIDFSRGHGAGVILVVNPIKYRLSPAHNIAQVVTEDHAGTLVEREIVGHLETAADALLVSDLDTAQPALEAAFELDPLSSLTNHYLGYLWEARGDPVRARSHFMTARERTIGGGGLMRRLNRAIREVAGRDGVRIVDLEEAFVRHSEMHGNGLADELISDWCHPSARGARVAYEELTGVVAVARSGEQAPDEPENSGEGAERQHEGDHGQ